MNKYEAIFILDPKLSDEQLAALKTDLQGKISAVGAQDILEIKFDRRPLTFPIRKESEAYYLIYAFHGPTDSVSKLRLELKHQEQILRMSYVRVPETPVVEPTPVAAPVAEPVVTPAPVAPVETPAADYQAPVEPPEAAPA